LWIGVGGLAVVAALVLGSGAVSGPAETPAAQPAPVRLPYDARGRIVPALQARVATIRGGVVRELPRVAGARVAARDELARLEAADGSIEVLSAPYGGTVLTVPVQLGDTVAPGQQVAVVGDLRELRVETTDVDEYLINRVEIGQPVELTVDALPGRTLNGRVVAVSLVAQAGAGGRLHYPVTVTLDRSDPSLRPSMTARLRFGGSSR
jgi:HlyD family secretion protein